MSETDNGNINNMEESVFRVYVVPLLLFAATFVTTTIAGAFWVVSPSTGLEVSQIAEGLPYSLSILAIL